MKRMEMIGGFGPQATIDYYRLLTETYKKRVGDESYPEIIINSMDINILFRMIADKKWDTLIEWLVNGLRALRSAGAEFGFISANTPHLVFDSIQERSPLPLISIVETARDRAIELGIRRIGLLGTKFTMQSDFYPRVLEKKGITVFIPRETEQNYIHDKYVAELEHGQFFDETRKGLLSIIKRMIEENSIEGVILGCTELPLILTKEEFGVPFLNTTSIHVESIVRYCVGG